jgi:hypothetical protein
LLPMKTGSQSLRASHAVWVVRVVQAGSDAGTGPQASNMGVGGPLICDGKIETQSGCSEQVNESSPAHVPPVCVACATSQHAQNVFCVQPAQGPGSWYVAWQLADAKHADSSSPSQGPEHKGHPASAPPFVSLGHPPVP